MENNKINNPTRSELITDFVKSNPKYYIKEFQKIGSKPSFSFSFNLFAGILGPIWFGMRNIWNWALAFLIIETFCVVQIIRGLFGNITKDAIEKIKQVESTIAFRNKQLEAAITNNPDKVDVYKRNIKSLEDAMQGYIDEVARIEASAIWITIFGISLLIGIKIVQGILANSILEKRYSEWLSDKKIKPGMQTKNFISSTVFASVIMFFSVIHYSFPGLITVMDNFPTHPDIRLTSIKWVETIFDYAVLKGDALFTGNAPFAKPKYSISVVVEHGGGGGKVAAPIARDVLLYALSGSIPSIQEYPIEKRNDINLILKKIKKEMIST